MKISSLFSILFLFFLFSLNAQVVNTGGFWTGIGDVNLTVVTTDADNGDGVGDGAIFSDGLSEVVGQGASYTFSGTMTMSESITINTYGYNDNVSYVRYNVELYNLTDSTVLVATPSSILISNNSSPAVLTTLNYTAQATDVGDVLQARYIRDDPGHTYRNLVIDNLYLGAILPANNVPLSFAQTCPFSLVPDLPLIPSSPAIDAEITLAVDRFSDSYLGTSAPSSGSLSSAESAYDALNISVTAGEISGDPITSFSTASFLKTFAQQLKFNPGDTNINDKANNTVWWVSKQFCTGALPRDLQKYAYEDFARPASLLKDFLDPDVKDLFAYTLYKHSGDFEHYWEAVYDSAYQTANGTIDTDLIYNIFDAMMAYVTWQDTDQERYRYMLGFQRYLERFFSYTVGTTDGIKADGSGFHHWTAYNNYMYAYKSAADIVYYLRGTSFQVDSTYYQVFRNAVYNQYIQANDDGVQGMSTNGRRPELRVRQYNQTALKRLAIAGGDILGLSTADPIFAGMYNRIHGVDPEFNYSTVSSFDEGFFQFNHASACTFRKGNWVAFNKGFTNNMWGGEIYTSQNRYGRYQSYGALEILYPGDKETGNGYDVDTWDWNYGPGTTVIRLPWDELHGERGRIDELQQKRFAGALSLNKKNSELLTNNHGDYGMFAMDFQEQEGQGFGVTHSSENHNSTFTFQKSSFYFDDVIVSLGSGISNDDALNSTITTLYQRLDNSANGILVNGVSQNTSGEVSFSGSSNNWILSNYNTGFYLLAGSHSLKVKKELQQNPNHNQIWPVNYSGNATNTYYTGYIDHGTSPTNEDYEYIIKPDATAADMIQLDTDIQAANKPYEVHQKDANAHIVEHIAKNIWGYSFFTSAAGLTYDFVTDVDASCLVMTEYDSTTQTLLLSLSNPDIGFDSRSYNPSITAVKRITLQGEWHFVTSNLDVNIFMATALETIIDFTTVDGLSYEVLLQQGPESCVGTTTFSSGTWDFGSPDSTIKAVFTEDYNTSSGNIEACTCEVKAGSKVTVGPNEFMNVVGNIAVNGTLVVEHEGIVVQTDPTANVFNNGVINVELTTPILSNRDFMVMGSPMDAEVRTGVFNSAFLVLNSTPANFMPHAGVPTGGTNFADDKLINGKFWDAYTGAINVGEGFIVRPQTGYGDPAVTSYDMTYTLGTLNTGDVTRPIVFNNLFDNPTGTPNILANPFPSPISASDLISTNTLINEVYFWEHLTPPSTSLPGSNNMNFSMDDISMYNGSMGVPAANDPGISTTPNGVISTGQGFAIKALASGTITFDNDMRLTSGNTTLRNANTEVPMNRLLIEVRNNDYGVGSYAGIAFNPVASFSEDENLDTERLATIVSLYSHYEDGSGQLGIQSLPQFEEGMKIPFGFTTQVTADLDYFISVASVDGNDLSNAIIYLIDNELGTITNLSETDYSFKSGKHTYDNRFTLQFESELLGSLDSAFEQIGFYPNPTSGKLTIASPETRIKDAVVYDISGRILQQYTFDNQDVVQIDLSFLHAAVYFVAVKTESGAITKRIIKK